MEDSKKSFEGRLSCNKEGRNNKHHVKLHYNYLTPLEVLLQGEEFV